MSELLPVGTYVVVGEVIYNAWKLGIIVNVRPGNPRPYKVANMYMNTESFKQGKDFGGHRSGEWFKYVHQPPPVIWKQRLRFIVDPADAVKQRLIWKSYNGEM